MAVIRFVVGSYVRARATFGTSIRGLVTNKLRALLLVVSIGIGISVVFVLVALMMGLTKSFTDQLSAMGANTYYVTARPWFTRGDWWKYRNRPPITRADVDALRRDANLLTAIAPVSGGTGDVGYLADSLTNVQVIGTTDEYVDVANLTVEAGRFMSPVEAEMIEPVVVIGSDLKTTLFHGADPIGQPIRVHDNRFRVIGVLKERGKSFGQSLDNLVIIPLGQFQRMYGVKRGLQIAMMTSSEHLETAGDQIVEILRRSRHLSAADEENFAVNRQSQIVKMFNEETVMLYGVSLVVGLITLVVGGVGVMNIMLVAVTERTREIGVRRALGARRNTILAQFIFEAILVTVLGGLFGVAFGIAACELVNLVSPIEAIASPLVAVAGLLVSGFVGLVSGVWPAFRAAQLDPIESLRYE